MMPETLNFNGNVITMLGFVGVVSTLIILVTVFRSFYNSQLK